MLIGIIGYGTVGQATARVFEDVALYDPPKGIMKYPRFSAVKSTPSWRPRSFLAAKSERRPSALAPTTMTS